MKIRRRDFLKAASGLAVGSVASSVSSLASSRAQTPNGKAKVAVFFEPSFPAEDGMTIDRSFLERSFAGYEVAFLGLNDLKDKLNAGLFQLLVLPYGSAFPKEAWVSVSRYLREGGNWLNLGGIPFSRPIVKVKDGWRREVRQTTYHKKLGITQAFPVSTSDIGSYRGSGAFDGSEEFKDQFKAKEVYEFYVRFTVTKDFPDEDGTGGARDARLEPLVLGFDKSGQRVAAPIIQIDRLQGDYAGGRWVLANFTGSISPKAVHTLADTAMQGAMEFTVRTSFATYRDGELPSITVQLRRPKGDVEQLMTRECDIELQDAKGKSLESIKLSLHGKGGIALGAATLSGRKNLTPGLYRIAASLRLPSVDALLRHTTGFWMYDEQLISSGKPYGLDSNYILRDGKPYPVTGTTYMISDVHRKFLLEPNPFLWDRDFAEMKQAGINMVRTGIWTGWKNMMLDVGAPNEVALRALDAFVLTARKYDIPLIFTLFAFVPEQWGGENPYLDPRSANAQKEFVSTLALRFQSVNDIFWDLINEPSFCNPKQLWTCRPNYDRFEGSAWANWLRTRVKEDGDLEKEIQIQEMHRAPADEPASLPTHQDFSDLNISDDHRPIKAVDYRLFAQEMFRLWIDQMTSAIRTNGNAHQFITVGQDEGGTGDRPNPQFFSDRVEFTCIHNWWLNDDLVWDNVLTKAPGKPNLVEETGVMFYEKMDGGAWRTENDAARLLERKLAISIGVGGAGFIEWIWNTNPFMKSDNEAAIGLFRADGTAKPELTAVSEYARFFDAQKSLMQGKQEEGVVLVIPHSNMFSTRNVASEATRHSVRSMYYHCNVPMKAVSEFRLYLLKEIPQLLILPSAGVLSDEAWNALLEIVEKGATLLLTGPIDANEHWLERPRLKQLGINASTRPVAQEESVVIGRKEYRLSYRGEKLQRIEKSVVDGSEISSMSIIRRGRGKILWSPLPVEISDTPDTTTALYRYALKEAGVVAACEVEQQNPSVLIAPTVFSDSVLYTLVSECDRDTEFKWTHRESNTVLSITVRAQRTALVFVNRKTGKVLAQHN
jgi:hypothetical protein